MKPDYNIGARNGLLDQKHLDQLGQAVWLYLWFLDRQPKDTDKVLGGQPITYQMFTVAFPDVPRATYNRWMDAIKKGGYISYVRTPRGLVITINKPKKWVKSDVSKMTHQSPKKTQSDVPKTRHQKQSDVSKMVTDVSKMIHAEDVSKMAIQYKRDSLDLQETTKSTNVDLCDMKIAEYRELISKMYYDTIKLLDIPVRNHNNLKSSIAKLASHKDRELVVNYFKFMQTEYRRLEWDFKPDMNEALDIANKRASVRNTFKKHIAKQQQPKPKGRGFTVGVKR